MNDPIDVAAQKRKTLRLALGVFAGLAVVAIAWNLLSGKPMAADPITFEEFARAYEQQVAQGELTDFQQRYVGKRVVWEARLSSATANVGLVAPVMPGDTSLKVRAVCRSRVIFLGKTRVYVDGIITQITPSLVQLDDVKMNHSANLD